MSAAELNDNLFVGHGGLASDAVVVTLSTVEPELIKWLWPGRLPLGKLVVLDGDPAVSKSTLALDLAARVSTGSPWPDGTQCVAGDVVVMSAEDGLADTIAPRLHAAGADLTRVHAITAVKRYGEDGDVRLVPPSLPRDLPLIAEVIEHRQVRLLIVDVLMAYLSNGTDSHKDQEVRGVLHQLAMMAEQAGCTIILIRHLNKSGGGHALYRGGGSIGITGAARATYLVGRDPDDTDRRILAVVKINIAAEPAAMAYRLATDQRWGCAKLEWETDPVDYQAGDLLVSADDRDNKNARNELLDWLTEYLIECGGVAPASEVLKAGSAAGFAATDLKRHRHKVATTKREGFGPGSKVWWRLRDDTRTPPIDSIGAIDSLPQALEPMGSMGNLWPDPMPSPPDTDTIF